MSVPEDNGLSEFFVAGVEPSDVPQFHALFAAKPLIGAMIALFRGGDDEVMVRLMVLREIGLRAEAPEWSPRDLQSHFAFINQSKLNTVLGRLREHDLLLWDNERHVYQHLLRRTHGAVRTLQPVVVQHRTGRRTRLPHLADCCRCCRRQVVAGSAGAPAGAPVRTGRRVLASRPLRFRIPPARGAKQAGSSCRQWMDKANEVMRNLSAEGFADDASWRLAQEIGSRQSRIMRMSSVFQRELAEITPPAGAPVARRPEFFRTRGLAQAAQHGRTGRTRRRTTLHHAGKHLHPARRDGGQHRRIRHARPAEPSCLRHARASRSRIRGRHCATNRRISWPR